MVFSVSVRRHVAAALLAFATLVAGTARAADRPLPSLATLLAVEDPNTPAEEVDSTPPGTIKDQPPKTLPEDEAPVYTKWWFWAITGVVVAGTVGLVVWASQPTETAAKPCSPGTLVCFGEGR